MPSSFHATQKDLICLLLFWFTNCSKDFLRSSHSVKHLPPPGTSRCLWPLPSCQRDSDTSQSHRRSRVRAGHILSRKYLKFFPKALLHFVGSFSQLAQFSHPALNLSCVDAGGVERLAGVGEGRDRGGWSNNAPMSGTRNQE